MTKRIPASTLYKIQRTDLNVAIGRLKSGETPPRFIESTRFDLLYEGRRYSPKAVVALAADDALGLILTPDNFSGGENSSAFRLLIESGFEIVTKPSLVGSLDATFSVGRSYSTTFLIFESKDSNRNVDYLEGLELVLLRLADRDVVITQITVDSATTRDLVPGEGNLTPDGYAFPIVLRDVPEINVLRRAISSKAARTARAPGSGGGGNPTKRLRIELDVNAETTLFELQQALAQDGVVPRSNSKVFKFIPSKPNQSSESSERRGTESGSVAHVHAAMQLSLYSKLVASYGEPSVSAEQVMASGNPADLVVQTSSGYIIYEIKTSLSPRECVRQALGQLLEYAHWPISEPVKTLFVVGPRVLDDSTKDYISILNASYGLPLQYFCEPEPEINGA